MAKKQSTQVESAVGVGVQASVLVQLQEARKRLVRFEKELVKRGRQQQRELEALMREVRAGKPLKTIERQAQAVGGEVKRRLDDVQGSVLAALGVASHEEVLELNREVARLSRKVEQLTSKRAPPASA